MSKSIQFKTNNENMYPHPYWPVGSIYLSVNTTNPNKWFGGTWEQIAKGRTLVGVDTSQTEFNAVKKTGGSKTHTLTVEQIPVHTHTVPAINYEAQAGNNTPVAGTQYHKTKATQRSGGTGGGKAHNNIQPYFTCYIWLRTA